MKRVLSATAHRRQIVILLLMTCCALAMTAPTLPSLATSTDSGTENIGSHPSFDISVTTPEAEPITTRQPSKIVNRLDELLPTSGNLDTITVERNATTTSDNLIGTDARATQNDDGTIKIHELNESASSPQMPSTVTTDLQANGPPVNSIETNDDNNSKSIISDRNGLSFAATPSTPATSEAPAVATTIDMPIKVDADNLKIMERERASVQQDVEAKKGKLKEGKKKALKSDKKQKLKQKLFTEINHPTIVPAANEPTTSADKASEVYETTHEATISTSIKTAPTTIKSTTLTTIKSYESDSDTTEPLSYTTEAAAPALNFNERVEPSVTASSEQRKHGDNVIVLNTNSSGLIVVDIMENFGTENASNTETFEIKMDLIDDASTTEGSANVQESKDDIFLTTSETTTSIDSDKSSKIDSATRTNDDIILINENIESATTPSSTRIKWNRQQLKSDEGNGNIKITFDNIDLPNQNVNVSIENGELVIDSIDISVLNKAEEELKKRKHDGLSRDDKGSNKTDSLEIILIEDDGRPDEKETNRDNLSENDESNLASPTSPNDENDDGRRINDDVDSHPTTIHFEVPNDRLKKIDEQEDGIKIKTTDKDSDTIFYISNTEVKVIESIPTAAPNVSQERKYFPAIYEEDVIVDVPNKNRTAAPSYDKYEEDIVLSPLTSDFDPKDINYIGEAFLDVEESQNGIGAAESRHIIPLTSDVVITPIQLRDMPNVGTPIIGELPPQIELEEMVFSDDYDSKQQTNFRVEEYYPNFLSNRLVKTNQLEADVPREMIFDTKNFTVLPNRTHISINTMINGTNMTAPTNSFPNATAFLVESDENNENADLNDIQTLLLACFATLMPLFLIVIIVLTIRYCWRKYRRQSSSGNDMMSDKSTDPLAETEKNIASSANELKAAEAGMLDRGGNMQASTELLLASNGDITPTNHTGTNGSIITMTLKNNHLIVETEERNDISRDTRETKMHYSPSEKDGVFIVESARGADQNGSHKPSPMQHKPTEAPLVIPEEIKIDTLQSHFTPSSPEEERKSKPEAAVEVHTPPAELKDDSKSEPVICNGTKTGLSQSDLSLTSSNSSNQNYSYGDKESYQFEEKGYKASSPKRVINVHCHDLKPLIENSPPAPLGDRNKPVITSAIFKNDSHDDREYLKSDAQAVHGNGIITPDKDDVLDKAKVHKVNGIIPTMKNGLDEIITVTDENCNDAIIPPPYTKLDCNGDSNMDSLSFLPAPPEELTNEGMLELTSLDSLPPPPPEMAEVGQS